MILVTGANGFVGSAILRHLVARQAGALVGAVRSKSKFSIDGIRLAQVGDLGYDQDWSSVLRDVHVVIHTAARVHVMKDTVSDTLGEFRRTNVFGTLNLAKQSMESGVKRFIYISSIKVNGEETAPNEAFQADAKLAPHDAYAISKMEAENGLRTLSQGSRMEVVIIRPPLIYGPEVKANFKSMMNLLRLGVPLPFGAILNRRSLVNINNLVSLIEVCISHPSAANQTFLVSDGEDLSTTDLLQRLAIAMDKPAHLIRVPISMLMLMANIFRKKHIVNRVCGSLQVDISKTKSLLGWSPPVTVDEGIKQTAQHFLANFDIGDPDYS